MARDEEYQRETREKIFGGTSWDSGPRVQSDQFLEWVADEKIFGVEHNGSQFYATYQFDRDGLPLPIIKEILQVLGDEDPWAIAAWFHFPNSWIAQDSMPVAPRDVLGRHDEILQAARCRTGTYVA
jgi:hypothetical protein